MDPAILNADEIDVSKIGIKYNRVLISSPVSLNAVTSYLEVMYNGAPLVVKYSEACDMRCDCQKYDSTNGYVRDPTNTPSNLRFGLSANKGVCEIDERITELISKYVTYKGSSVIFRKSGEWVNCRCEIDTIMNEPQLKLISKTGTVEWKPIVGRRVRAIPAITYKSVVIRSNSATSIIVLSECVIRTSQPNVFNEHEIASSIAALEL